MKLTMAALLMVPVYVLVPICANAQEETQESLLRYVKLISTNIELLQDLRTLD